ncbi:hypothetical protein F5Y12DRAFT_712320 [Xylaria sp. FL1777]|nr:hypothetical protein F5Y12DRAFT_712320 [Xylaria sp. FL1777]
MQKVTSAFSTSWWINSVALYSSTTISETNHSDNSPFYLDEYLENNKALVTFGDGIMEYIAMILSEYSSRMFEKTSKRVRDLKPLQIVTTLCLPHHDMEHLINELGAFGIMALCLIVAGAGLAKNYAV